mgnify:CR=1 FL=1
MCLNEKETLLSNLFSYEKLSKTEAKQFSPLTLAFLGDAVYELEIRRFLCRNGSVPSKILHKNKVTYVCAAYQALARLGSIYRYETN